MRRQDSYGILPVVRAIYPCAGLVARSKFLGKIRASARRPSNRFLLDLIVHSRAIQLLDELLTQTSVKLQQFLVDAGCGNDPFLQQCFQALVPMVRGGAPVA